MDKNVKINWKKLSYGYFDKLQILGFRIAYIFVNVVFDVLNVLILYSI